MPSAALGKFESNLLVDVDRLIESHEQLNHAGRGRRGLGHITRSAVLMLCAAWELYIEEVLLESVHHLKSSCQSPNELPLTVRKELAKCVRDAKDELKPLELAGDGWRTTFRNHTVTTIAALNTPKSSVLDPLFQRFLGLADVSAAWSETAAAVNAFVECRGEIAHRGRDARYVTVAQARSYRRSLLTTVVDTDNKLAEHLRAICPCGRVPWRRRA